MIASSVFGFTSTVIGFCSGGGLMKPAEMFAQFREPRSDERKISAEEAI